MPNPRKDKIGMTTATAVRGREAERAPAARVTTLPPNALTRLNETPKLPGQRLKARREYLTMKQDEVAEELGLSRTAYGQYETGASHLTVERAQRLASILGCSAAWLAFGTDDTKTIQRMQLVDGKFEPTEPWVFDETYLQDIYHVRAHKVALVDVELTAPSLQIGDLAIVEKGVEPSHAVGEFVFILDGAVMIANLSRLVRSDTVRVHANHREFNEVPRTDLDILGRVVGKIAKL